MTARPASLENALALHHLNCVDCPSSLEDISVASLGSILRLSAAGKFAYFPYVPVFSSRLRAVHQFHLPWGCPGDSRLDKRCSKSSLQYLSEAGQCRVQQKMSCLPKEVLSVPRVFSFFFFLLNRAFTRSCWACEGFSEETIL